MDIESLRYATELSSGTEGDLVITKDAIGLRPHRIGRSALQRSMEDAETASQEGFDWTARIDVDWAEMQSDEIPKSRVPWVLAFGVLGLGARGAEDVTVLNLYKRDESVVSYSVRRISPALVSGLLLDWEWIREVKVRPRSDRPASPDLVADICP